MKQFFAFMAAAMISLCSLAQLPDGSFAPDFTLMSIDGVEYNLYSMLDSGYQVIVEFSATWCGPCWNYHQSGVLEELYETYGPDGTNEIRVCLIEADDTTPLEEIYGSGTSQGDWTEGTNFPIFDDGGATFDAFGGSYYPTIYTICPSRILTESGQVSVEEHAAIFQANSCQPASEANDPSLIGYTGETLACGENPVSLEVDLMNMGLTNLTACTIKAYEGTNEVASVDWTGDLQTYSIESVVVGETSVTSPTDFTFEISSSDDNPLNNSVGASIEVSIESTPFVRVEIFTDAYPTETGWSITDENGTQVAGSPTGSLTETGTEYIWEVQLNPGCYIFTITDAFGDGLASSWYNGIGPDGSCQLWSTWPSGDSMNELFAWSPETDDWFSSLDMGFEVIPQVNGCTSSVACNFDPNAWWDDGSCEYPEPYFDCVGACLNDTDGDGVCDELEILGCGVESACNYDAQATDQDFTLCVYPGDACDDQDPNTSGDTYNSDCACIGQGPQPGCTNPVACNYDEEADYSDGSCAFEGDACDDGDATTSGDMYGEDCLCAGEPSLIGCINTSACNYNPNAIESDGSCVFPNDPCDDSNVLTTEDMWNSDCECEGTPPASGCINPAACNYDPEAVTSDGSCLLPGDECDDGDFTTVDDVYDDACVCVGEPSTVGCMDALACNYNAMATEDDGSCLFTGNPCDDGDDMTSNDMIDEMCNCMGTPTVAGCINPIACNYDSDAVTSDGSCLFPGDPCNDGDESTPNDMYNDSCECEGESAIVGCINPNACNYNVDATESDGSCLFPGDPCDDGDASTANDMYNDSCECQGDEPSQVSEDFLELTLFPNPVHDWLSVRLEDGLAASLILFDPMGRVIQTWSTIGTTRLDLSHLPSGPYVMSIRPPQGPARSERVSVLTRD